MNLVMKMTHEFVTVDFFQMMLDRKFGFSATNVEVGHGMGYACVTSSRKKKKKFFPIKFQDNFLIGS